MRYNVSNKKRKKVSGWLIMNRPDAVHWFVHTSCPGWIEEASPVYSGTLVKTKIDKFLNVSGSRHCSIEQQCREVALCWRDVPDG